MNGYTFRGSDSLSTLFCLPSEKGVIWREEFTPLWEQSLSFWSGLLFGRVVGESKQEATKVVSLVKMTEIYQVYPVPLNNQNWPRRKLCSSKGFSALEIFTYYHARISGHGCCYILAHNIWNLVLAGALSFLQDCMCAHRRYLQGIPCVAKDPKRLQAHRLWSDCADAQADLSLYWARIQSGRKCY